MRSSIYWIDAPGPGRLAIAARPRSGDWLEDEIAGWASENVDAVVSLLENHEISELSLDEEQTLCHSAGVEFISFPIPDRGLPRSLSEAISLVQSLDARLRVEKRVVIHCRAGIGRSALVAASVLVARGLEPDEAFDAISAARGVRVPDTDAQKLWVRDFLSAYRSASTI